MDAQFAGCVMVLLDSRAWERVSGGPDVRVSAGPVNGDGLVDRANAWKGRGPYEGYDQCVSRNFQRFAIPRSACWVRCS